MSGERAKTPWSWWAGLVGEETYANELPTRDEAIAWARREWGADATIEVIEARCWDGDGVSDEDFLFAETRNHEVLAG